MSVSGFLSSVAMVRKRASIEHDPETENTDIEINEEGNSLEVSQCCYVTQPKWNDA